MNQYTTSTRFSTLFAAFSIVLALSGCATSMPTAKSGYLSNYDNLTVVIDQEQAVRQSVAVIDPTRIEIVDVSWQANPGVALSTQEQASLLAQLRSELGNQFKLLPASAPGRAIKVRAAITRVETVSPSLNVISTILLLAPIDRGGAAIEIEAIDAETKQQLAALTLGYYPPMSDFKARFSKLAPTELALKKAAQDFAHLLQIAAAAH